MKIECTLNEKIRLFPDNYSEIIEFYKNVLRFILYSMHVHMQHAPLQVNSLHGVYFASSLLKKITLFTIITVRKNDYDIG